MNVPRVSFAVLTLCLALLLGTIGASLGFGQATGNILGTVVDPSDAPVAGVTINVTNTQLGVQRTVQTNESGTYVVSALLPAEYDVSAEMQGFRKTLKHVTLNAGGDITVDLALVVGETSQSVSVEAQAVNIDLVSSKVDADVNPTELTQLPLIGRSAYEMAKLSPGVTVTATPGRNSDVSVFMIGKTFTDTRITLNGVDVSNFVAGGEPEMNFPQDLVQEFQVSINNGDPSNGISLSGTINLATRRGGNDYHGSAYGYFRNSQFAGYPGISHPAVIANPTNDPAIVAFNATNAAPNFYRRQFGGIIGGPIRKDHLYWLASVEDTQQEAAAIYNPNFAAFATAFSSVGLAPKNRLLASLRLDWQVNKNNTVFLMAAQDRLRSRTIGNTQPSMDGITSDNASVGMIGWTRIFSSNFVGDFRFAFDYFNLNSAQVPEAYSIAQQFAPNSDLATIGNVTVLGTNMIFGSRTDVPQGLWTPRPQATANFTYSKGSNTWKFGLIAEPAKFAWWRNWFQPMAAIVFNPTQAAAAGIPIPASFNTIADILQLPLQSVSIGIGNDATYPFSFLGDNVRWSQIYNVYGGSSYRATRKLTLNWSLLYNYNGIAPNRDLPLPVSLAPFVGTNLHSPQNEKRDFAPSVGFAWDPFGHGKTVIRGGSGYYYGTQAPADPALGRANLLPVGDANTIISGTILTNPKTGNGTIFFPTAGLNASAGIFRLSDMVNNLAAIRSNLLQTVFTNNNTNFSVTNFDYFKGGNTYPIYVPNFRQPVTLQNMLGMQQQVGDWLFAFTAIYNVTNHTQFTYDANRNLLGTAGKVVQGFGAVVLGDSGGKSVYNGQIITAKKAVSHHFMVDAAYTHAIANSTIAEVFIPLSLINYNDRADNYGPVPSVPSHLFTLGATLEGLPWHFEVSFINVMQSKAPYNPILSGLDLNGDGTINDHLPEIGWDRVNRGCDIACLRNAVADFNQNYASTSTTTKLDKLGTKINAITLPAAFATGHSLITQDIRLTKKIHIHERFNVNLAAEMFNILNLANLNFAASTQNLYSSGFGQPTDRNGTYFGTGGPRAMQFSARLNF